MNGTSSSDEEGDDAEKMWLAFESFMLTGKKPNAEETNDFLKDLGRWQQKAKKKDKAASKKHRKALRGGAIPPLRGGARAVT